MKSNFQLKPAKTMNELGTMISGMRAAYAQGKNAMEYARSLKGGDNSLDATLIAYDLQAGTYIDYAEANPDHRFKWGSQIAKILNSYIDKGSTILEVGSGEATTLASVVSHLENTPRQILGFDISWSRCAYGLSWLQKNKVNASLFVADLFEIPLEDNSVDVVYTSHSLEPNGGREEDAIRELMRIARKALVLIEPLYEFADAQSKARMNEHGYVKGLQETAVKLGANVIDHRLLDYTGNPHNPSGVVMIEKSGISEEASNLQWRCPLTHAKLYTDEQGFYSPDTGIVYFVLSGIPLLMEKHAVVASSFEKLAISK
jgi:uncharacterized protein YbaR (Trm112 family)